MTTGEPFPYEPPQGQNSGAPRTPPPRRSRARRLVPLCVAAWLVLEIWLLTVVAGAISGLAVFGLIVGGFVVGSIVIKRAGRRAWRELAETLQPGTAPEAAPPRGRTSGSGNALAMLGGLLIMLPGLVSDVAGLLLVFPPTAALLRRIGDRYLMRGSGLAASGLGDAFQQARTAGEQARMHRPDGKIVQGEVIRDEDEK